MRCPALPRRTPSKIRGRWTITLTHIGVVFSPNCGEMPVDVFLLTIVIVAAQPLSPPLSLSLALALSRCAPLAHHGLCIMKKCGVMGYMTAGLQFATSCMKTWPMIPERTMPWLFFLISNGTEAFPVPPI